MSASDQDHVKAVKFILHSETDKTHIVVVLKGVLVLQACPSKTCAKLQFQSSRALHLLIARGRRAARGQ